MLNLELVLSLLKYRILGGFAFICVFQRRFPHPSLELKRARPSQVPLLPSQPLG